MKKNGKIDKATFNVLIGKGKVASKTNKNSTKSSKSTPKSVKTINIKSNNAKVISNQLLSKNDIKKLQGDIK